MVMYGRENWALNRSERRKTETADRRVSGQTLAGQARNTVRSELRIRALKKKGKAIPPG
jgi:hypothetical protein